MAMHRGVKASEWISAEGSEVSLHAFHAKGINQITCSHIGGRRSLEASWLLRQEHAVCGDICLLSGGSELSSRLYHFVFGML